MLKRPTVVIPAIIKRKVIMRGLCFLLALVINSSSVSGVFAISRGNLRDINRSTPAYRSDGEEVCVIGNTKITNSDEPAASPEPSGTPDKNPDSSNRQKAASLLFVRANTLQEVSSLVSKNVGGIFLGPSDKNDAAFFSGVKSAVNGKGLFVAVDFEGGRIQRPGSGLVGEVPTARAMGALSDDEIKTIANEKGLKLADYGINMDFAPVVDIGGINNTVIGDRAFANDAESVIKKAGAFASGLSSAGIMPVIKHFPGHGSTEGDSHSAIIQTKSLAELERSDMKPFKSMGSNGKLAIMMGHLKVPDWGETVTSLNPKAYEYLRITLNYNGLIITDALDMTGVGSPSSQSDRAVLAIKAGADMALLNSAGEVDDAITKLEAALNSGDISSDQAAKSVERIKNAQNNASVGPSNLTGACSPCTAIGSIPVDGENPGRVFAFFISKGMAPNQAAGFVGNLMMESGPGISPTALNPTSAAFGIAQWLGGRLSGLKQYASDKGGDYQSFEIQLSFLWDIDIPSQINGGFPKIAEVTVNNPSLSLEDATQIIMDEFERPGPGTLDKRIGFAKGVLDKYGGGAAVAIGSPSSGSGCPGRGGSSSAKVGDLAWPVDVKFWNENPEWFTKPHHDYPASDIPVNTGTPVYSIAAGVARLSGGSCGTGVTVTSGNVSINYCHGIPGSVLISSGETVSAGQQIFTSDNSGNSTGDHLHVGIFINGVKHCPQELFKLMGAGETNIDFSSLPTSGCSY